MSTLLEQASLVMIPSGYKEDVVYSQIPTSGAGDLSFTRASNGTRVNSAGLVEVTPWNIVQESETFTNAIWNLYYATVTSNSQTAPNGTLTADTLNSTTQQYSGIYQQLGTLPTNVYTYSIYVKAGTNTFFGMLGQGSGSQIAIFNLSTGVVSSISNLDSASIENVGNGWYRCQIQKTGAGVEMLIFSSNIANSIPTASGTVFIWGAQVNIGSTAKPYFPTTDRLNVPRLTYQNGGGGCPSLLLEKQSTNLVTYSEDFTNSDWNNAGGASVVANNAISPDGTQNADTSLTSAVNGLRNYVGGITNGASYTLTLYVKQASSSSATHVRLTVNNTSNWTGAASIKVALTNEWQRITLNWTATGTAAYFLIGSADETGNGDASCYGNVAIWGAQLEQSSYATSYIQTQSSSATRVADACFKTGISSLIGASEGVLFTDFVCNGFENYGTPLCVNDGTVNNSIWLTTFGDGTLRGEVFGSGSVQASFSMSGAVVGQRYKMALAYKANDFAMYINGTQIGTDSSGSVPSSLSRVDYDYANPSAFALSLLQINQSALFPTRLTNAELASLTTI